MGRFTKVLNVIILTSLKLACAAAFLLAGPTKAVWAQYRFDSWTTEHGLPQNTVTSILQTRDGYLWFTTLDGLVRYNGAQFTVFNRANTSQFNSQRFTGLQEDRDGNLWIRGEDGSLLRHRDGAFTGYTTAHGLPHHFVLEMGLTVDGALLVQTERGVARFEQDRFETIPPEPNGLAGEVAYHGRSGTVWYRRETELRRVRDGQVTIYQVPKGGYRQIYEDREGRCWMSSSRPGNLVMVNEAGLRLYTVKDGLPNAEVSSFYEDRAGTLWLATRGGGLVRFKDEKFTVLTTEQGLSSDSIRAVYQDRENVMWLGTFDNGLMRMTPQVITAYSERDGMVGKAFYPVIEDRSGNIWIANHGVNRLKDGTFTFYPLNTIHPQRKSEPLNVSSLYEDNAGRLLLGADTGLLVFENEKFAYDKTVSLPKTPLSMYQDSQGAYWFGLNDELLRVKDGVTQRFDNKDGLQGAVQPIHQDRQGRLWFGSHAGLVQYINEGFRFFTVSDGLSSNQIRAIYEDAEGVLWIGTYDGGLNRFKDGSFTHYTTAEGMFSNNVFSILEDGRGNLWMGSNQGIYRVSRRQLNEFAEGKRQRIDSVAYGKADGMLSAECNGRKHPSAFKAHDGRLWFPTLNGVAVVDPEAVTHNSRPRR